MKSMKAELKKDISEVMRLLGQRDAAWKHPKMVLKFKQLYGGWVAQQVRHRIRTRDFYSRAWQRNWLPIEDWRQFESYAMQ